MNNLHKCTSGTWECEQREEDLYDISDEFGNTFQLHYCPFCDIEMKKREDEKW